MANQLIDSDSSGEQDDVVAKELSSDFKINQTYAERFTFNKKREERQQLEEKFDNHSRKRRREEDDVSSGESETSSSDSEDEDDMGELATKGLDLEINATLEAIRSKDPRVYNQNTTFYSAERAEDEPIQREKAQRPLFLRDYHRTTLLDQRKGKDAENTQPTYEQEQNRLKQSIVGQINDLARPDSSDDEDAGFLVSKTPAERSQRAAITRSDIEDADRDPETYLSNFMASRGWVPTSEAKFEPLESDDEDEERKADEFEEAYNFRFEDPEKSNEKLQSHARDVAAKHSVRREEKNPRQQRRDLEKARKGAAKQELLEAKARLRRLKVEEAQAKVQRIKQAAGLSSKQFRPEDWMTFVDQDWDDANWEQEMKKRFDDAYYAAEDIVSDAEDTPPNGSTTRQRRHKPKWNEDVDIKDLVPEFDDSPPQVNLSEDESKQVSTMPAKTLDAVGKDEAKRDARRDRRIIETLVDSRLDSDPAFLANSHKTAGFRYRQTSPHAFGLSSTDILLADDTQLNQYVGLKKLAAFRDPDKKRRDKKRLGKKARLRKWRQDTFGYDRGRQKSLEVLLPRDDAANAKDEDGGVDVRTSERRRRRKGKKSQTVAV